MTTIRGGIEKRIDRLNRASERHVIDPDVDVAGHLGTGQILPDELLSIHGMDLQLSVDRKAQLAREEVAALMDLGIRLEAVLMAGLCLDLSARPDLNDPRTVFALHEVGEETRHSRLFLRLIDQLQPRTSNPFVGRRGLGRWLEIRFEFAIVRRPALFTIVALGGKEITDLMQKLSGEHPDTDPFLAAVNRYHRQEEAPTYPSPGYGSPKSGPRPPGATASRSATSRPRYCVNSSTSWSTPASMPLWTCRNGEPGVPCAGCRSAPICFSEPLGRC
jgi:P-aminobenzoate N-oxygenase AurF